MIFTNRMIPKRDHAKLHNGVISRKKLREFWEDYPDTREVLQAWYADAKQADWQSPADIKSAYVTASILPHNRVVFNIKGNHYRLVVVAKYEHGVVYIRFVGTHGQYDRIDATRI